MEPPKFLPDECPVEVYASTPLPTVVFLLDPSLCDSDAVFPVLLELVAVSSVRVSVTGPSSYDTPCGSTSDDILNSCAGVSAAKHAAAAPLPSTRISSSFSPHFQIHVFLSQL